MLKHVLECCLPFTAIIASPNKFELLERLSRGGSVRGKPG